MNAEHKKIVEDYELENKLVYATVNRPAFFNLKDTKETFKDNPTIRLLNPQKPEVGKISKKLLDNICHQVILKTKLNLFKNSYEVIDWFLHHKNPRNNRNLSTFIIFDIVDYYPSVTEDLLNHALDWASQYVEISRKDRNAILKSKDTFLYYENRNWVKRSGTFNIGIGTYDGGETTDIVGLFLLSKLQNLGFVSGAYRDDGIGISNLSPRQNEKMKDKLSQIFNSYGLKLDIKVNLSVVDYLDITMNLRTGSYAPYMKPGDVKHYVHRLSNHPPAVLRNIPQNINDRLCRLSSSKEIFLQAIPPYQDALIRAGYDHKLTYEPNRTDGRKKQNRVRRRNCVHFNPVFSRNVETNIIAEFLKIVREFPRNNILKPMINTNKIKASYRTVPNMARQVSRKNGRILRKNMPEPPKPGCNCQRSRKDDCPCPGQCTISNVCYSCEVVREDDNSVEYYVGQTTQKIKTRIGQHKRDAANYHPSQKEKKISRLSHQIGELELNRVPYHLEWSILSKENLYDPVSDFCSLCNREKYLIMCPERATLNLRSELFGWCFHKTRNLLKNL